MSDLRTVSAMDLVFYVARCVIAIMLAAASVLKIYAFVVYGESGAFAEWLVPVVAAIEILVVVQLCFSRRVAMVWWSTLLCLIMLAAMQGGRVIWARSESGYLGLLHLSPWVVLSICLAGIVVWVFVRPRGVNLFSMFSECRDLPGSLTGWEGGIVGVFAFACVFSVYTAAGFFSPVSDPQHGLVEIVPAVIELGEVTPGQPVVRNLRVQNNFGRSVTIVGGGSGCGCLTLDSLPVNVPAGETRMLRIEFIPGYADPQVAIEKPFYYYLDHPHQYSVKGVVRSFASNSETERNAELSNY